MHIEIATKCFGVVGGGGQKTYKALNLKNATIIIFTLCLY